MITVANSSTQTANLQILLTWNRNLADSCLIKCFLCMFQFQRFCFHCLPLMLYSVSNTFQLVLSFLELLLVTTSWTDFRNTADEHKSWKNTTIQHTLWRLWKLLNKYLCYSNDWQHPENWSGVCTQFHTERLYAQSIKRIHNKKKGQYLATFTNWLCSLTALVSSPSSWTRLCEECIASIGCKHLSQTIAPATFFLKASTICFLFMIKASAIFACLKVYSRFLVVRLSHFADMSHHDW